MADLSLERIAEIEWRAGIAGANDVLSLVGTEALALCSAARKGIQSPGGVKDAERALGLLAAEDTRNDKLHDLLETIREQIRLEVAPEHRPAGLMQNIQNAVYAMRGRTRLMDDAQITGPLSTIEPVESPDRLPVGKPEGWRAAIQRVRNQLGQAGGTGTAGAQNSITEREVGGWVLDAVEDELAALTIVASPGQPVESPAPGVREALRSIIGMAVTARSGQLHGTWADGLTEIAAFASAALSAPAAEPLAGEPRLPCDVRLPPATVLRAGVPFSTLITALMVRGMSSPPSPGEYARGVEDKPEITDEREALERLAAGDTIAFSRDGDNAWFIGGNRAWIDSELVINMREMGYLPEAIIARYEAMLPVEVPARCEPNPGTSTGHLKWMLNELRTMRDEAKAMRWLGFIQGIMIGVRGHTTVEAEREFTRPFFTRPAAPLPASVEMEPDELVRRLRVDAEFLSRDWTGATAQMIGLRIESAAATILAERARAVAAEGERDEANDRRGAEALSWANIISGLEAHLKDRVAMGDQANPQLYLDIVQGDLKFRAREAEQIYAATQHRSTSSLAYGNAQFDRAEAAESENTSLKAKLAEAMEARDQAERAAVTAVIPLEALNAVGNETGHLSEAVWTGVLDGVAAVRTLMDARRALAERGGE